MTRETFTIAAVAFFCSTAAAAPLVTFESPCECRDNPGKQRWAKKNDPSQPPTAPLGVKSHAQGKHVLGTAWNLTKQERSRLRLGLYVDDAPNCSILDLLRNSDVLG